MRQTVVGDLLPGDWFTEPTLNGQIKVVVSTETNDDGRVIIQCEDGLLLSDADREVTVITADEAAIWPN